MAETPDFERIRAELRRLTMAVHMSEATMADLGAYVGLHVDAITDALKRGDRRPKGLMPETPDFEQLARAIVKAHDNADGEGMDGNPAFLPIDHEGQLTIAIVEQLRLMWNARGAADIAKLEELQVIPDDVSDDAIRSLDR